MDILLWGRIHRRRLDGTRFPGAPRAGNRREGQHTWSVAELDARPLDAVHA